MKQRTRVITAKALGEGGEIKAAEFLIKKGFEILEKNYRFKRLEIDIVALDEKNDELVFVEVKQRSSGMYGHPSLAVNSKKISNLQTAAEIYIQRNRLNKSYRFDIISVLPNKVEHFENVTMDL